MNLPLPGRRGLQRLEDALEVEVREAVGQVDPETVQQVLQISVGDRHPDALQEALETGLGGDAAVARERAEHMAQQATRSDRPYSLWFIAAAARGSLIRAWLTAQNRLPRIRPRFA
jgi:hypothetical protein